MMHSPRTAPTTEVTLKFTHNKTSSNVKEKVDELHLHDKINKLKSYYKSAQGLIADEMSRKAHRSRVNKLGSPGLSRCLSDNPMMFRKQSANHDLVYNSIHEQSVHMFGSFKQKLYESQQNTLNARASSINESELPAIKESNSTHRPSVNRQAGNKVDIKTIFKENLKNKTLHHKNIIDAYFKDRNLVQQKQQNIMFKSFN